jgi:hypothetical protein
MPRHDDVAAEDIALSVETGDRAAFIGGEQSLKHRPAVAVEMRGNARPILRSNTRRRDWGEVWAFAAATMIGSCMTSRI